VNPIIEQARGALDAGRADEAILLLWQALEPARLAGDDDALREIASLARATGRREGEDLAIRATGQLSSPQPPAPPAPRDEPQPSRAPAFRTWRLVFPLLVTAALAASFVNALSRPAQVPGTDRRPVPATVGGDAAYLVPLAGYPRAELERLVLTIHRRTGQRPSMLAPVTVRPELLDPHRGQLVAEDLLGRLAGAYDVRGNALVLGVTHADMYERKHPEREFAVAVRSPDGRYAVLSTARLGRGPERRKRTLRRILHAYGAALAERRAG
jgi:hypothetical protein